MLFHTTFSIKRNWSQTDQAGTSFLLIGNMVCFCTFMRIHRGLSAITSNSPWAPVEFFVRAPGARANARRMAQEGGVSGPEWPKEVE